MQLTDVLTEQELDEINLGKLAGSVARGVGAVAGGAAGAWDAAKQGFAKGRERVTSQDDEESDTDGRGITDFHKGFDQGRANVSGVSNDPVDKLIDMINDLSKNDKQRVLAALGYKTSLGGYSAGTSSTGGTITPTDTGLVHRAKPQPVAQPSAAPAAAKKPAVAKAPKATATTTAAKPAAKTAAKPAAKTAAKPARTAKPKAASTVTEALRASQEEIALYRDEIKRLNDMILMMNDIYNRFKKTGDDQYMQFVKNRMAVLSRDRSDLLGQLEARMSSDQFDTLKEELEI